MEDRNSSSRFDAFHIFEDGNRILWFKCSMGALHKACNKERNDKEHGFTHARRPRETIMVTINSKDVYKRGEAMRVIDLKCDQR